MTNAINKIFDWKGSILTIKSKKLILEIANLNINHIKFLSFISFYIEF